MLTLFNSLTKQKEIFKPIVPGHIKIYVCGMTVYDYCHIGNARSWVVFDVIVRYLRARGWQVTYVRNITDVDDKIIDRAHKNKESCEAVVTRFINAMQEDEAALGVAPPDAQPRATQYIPYMIALIQKLITNGFAYVGETGDVYYQVRHKQDYGKLSHLLPDDLQAGARVEVSENKRDPLDFTLWKLAKPHEPQWESPWGRGRPGWHIECSAMSGHLLGQPFDLHGGGLDLKFPHHENEIAQSEAAENKSFVHTWMHVGMLEIAQAKMSKSLGNIITVRDALKIYDAEELRYFLLSAHYRSALNYSPDNLSNAHDGLARLYLAMRHLKLTESVISVWTERFNTVMDDDFNTPQALAILFDMAREINKLKDENNVTKAALIASELKQLGSLLGILQRDPEIFLQGKVSLEQTQHIEALIAEREAARVNKDWATADRVRTALSDMGVVIEDTAQGTQWRRES